MPHNSPFTAPTLDRSIAYTTFDEDTGTVEVCVVGGGIAVDAVLKTTDSSDYICIYEIFTIGPGERKCFIITIVDDVVAERSTERVNIDLTSAGTPHTFSDSGGPGSLCRNGCGLAHPRRGTSFRPVALCLAKIEPFYWPSDSSSTVIRPP